MISGISDSGGYMTQMQMQEMRQRPNQGERFNQLDADKNGGIDQTELQTMTDQISQMTGQQINVEEVSKTYDTNSDGLLARDEMQTMMMELRDKTGGPPQGGQNRMQALAAYQSDQDPTSILLDMLNGQEDEEEYIPLNTRA